MGIKRVGKGFDFKAVEQKYSKFKQTAPKIIANNSLNWFLDGFRNGGGQTDSSKGGWDARQPNADRNEGRGLLVDSSALRNSIQILKCNFKGILIGTMRIRYAKRHNEGLLGMPKREFIGDSKEMDASNKKLLVKLITKIFK